MSERESKGAERELNPPEEWQVLIFIHFREIIMHEVQIVILEKQIRALTRVL